MMQKRLSIGILVESYNVPNWVYTMLEKILIDDCAQIVAVVVNSSYNALEQDKTTYNLFERIFYSAMYKMDCKLYKYELDVLLKLGFGELRGSALGCAKYGVWTHQLDELFLFYSEDLFSGV